MANFDLAFRFMASHEWNKKRNYTNDPDDPGGPTKFGITLSSWRKLGTLGDLNHDGKVDEKDIMILEEPEARLFYFNRYWIWDRIKDDALAAKLFDIGVNLGPGRAVIYLQTALRHLGKRVTIDGIMGPQTAGAANDTDPAALMAQIVSIQREHYEAWIKGNPVRKKYHGGLIARAAAVPARAVGTATA